MSDTGGLEVAYPARTGWKGFSESDVDEAYQKLESHMRRTNEN
jgi:hypothetical protein